MTGASAAAADHAAKAAGDTPAVGAIAIVGGRAALLVPGGNLLAPVADLKAALLGDDPVDAFLRLVSRTALAELPPFVCAVRETELVRLLVRGSAGACVRSSDGFEVKLTASRVATWAERVVDAPAEILLFADVSDSSATTVTLLWADLTAPRRTPRHLAPPTDAESRGAHAVPAVLTPDPVDHLVDASAPASAPAARDGFGLGPDDSAGQPQLDLAHLLEQTGHRDVEDAAVRERHDEAPMDPVEPGAGAMAGPRGLPTRQGESELDDTPIDPNANDGNTISMAKLRAAIAAPVAGATAPQVQTVVCGRGHANPPYADRCRSCSAGIVDRKIRMLARPSLGRLRFNDGLVVELDRPALVGRRPRAPQSDGGGDQAPALIAIADPELLLSRVHVEIRLDGWQVLVVDRHSVNCTYVELPGQPVRQLRPDEPFLIEPGARVDLAHIAAFVYEVAQADSALP